MSAKGRKSQRRRSTHQHTTPIIQEADIKCVFCDRSDEEVEQAVANKQLQEDRYNRWVECSSCESWMHLDCLDDEMGKIQAPVNDALWKRIRNFNEWNFTCLRCGERRPIPAQLEFQGIFTREELLSINISEDNLLKRMARDPIIADDWEEKEEDRTIEQSDRTQNPDVDIETPVPMNEGGIVVQPQEANAGAAAPGLVQNPVNVQVGAFDMMQLMQCFQQQQHSLIDKIFEREKEKEASDRQERERKEANDRQERERKDALERERRQREDNERWERLFQSSSSGASSSSPNGQTSKPATLQLPKVQLPHFDGTISKWPEFWDLYNNMVHRNADLPKIQKFSFLKQSLMGPAASVIASYRITEDNYDAVIQKLKDRYDDKVIIKEELYNQLQSLPVSGTKGTELRKTFDVITSVRIQLTNTGEDVDNPNSTLFLHLVMQKFPNQVKQKLNEKKGDQMSWTTDLFFRLLESHIKLLEQTWGSKDSRDSQTISREKQPQRSNVHPPQREIEQTVGRGTTSNLIAGARNPSRTNQAPYPCAFCGTVSHFSAFCPDVIDVDRRKQTLKDSKRCFLCLKPDHVKQDCRHRNRITECQGCGLVGEHHKAICPDWIQKTYGIQQVRTEIHQDTGISVVAQMSKQDTISAVPEPKSLPPVCSVQISAKDKDIWHTGRILLDTACNRTWISEDFARKLQGGQKDSQKDKKDSQKVIVNTFGSNEPKTYKSSRLEIKMISTAESKDGHMHCCGESHMSAWTKPGILMKPIQRFTLSRKDKDALEKDLCGDQILATDTIPEDSPESLAFQPDVIIGADNYYAVRYDTGIVATLPSGLKLDMTKFGYILAGCCTDSNHSGGTEIAASAVSSQRNLSGGGSRPRRRRKKKKDLTTLKPGTYHGSTISRLETTKTEITDTLGQNCWREARKEERTLDATDQGIGKERLSQDGVGQVIENSGSKRQGIQKTDSKLTRREKAKDRTGSRCSVMDSDITRRGQVTENAKNRTRTRFEEIKGPSQVEMARKRIMGQLKDDEEDWLATTLSVDGTESHCGKCHKGKRCGSAFSGVSYPTVTNVTRENDADLHFLVSPGVSLPVNLRAKDQEKGKL